MAAAAMWYENQSPGLGSEFLRAAEACISSVARNPAMYSVMHREIRRALFRRFPYGIFFILSGDSVTIIACLHVKQNLKRLEYRQ